MTSNFLKNALAALFGLLVFTAGALAANVSVSGSLNAGSPTFNRPTDRAGFPDSANNALPYNAIEIKTGSLGGTITATINGANTEFDSFLALYSSFSEGSPGANLLAADDDGGTYPHALLTANGLAANTSYWLVVTSYSGSANSVFPLYGNYALTISGDLLSYSITATASPLAGGSVSCTPNPVPHGSSSTCTATANVGYTFTGFSGACSGATCVLSNVTSDASVTANFTLDTYAITTTASPLAGGAVSCSPNPVPHGSSSTCTATPNAGYTFTGFSGACSGATCVLSNVTSVKSVTATFTLNTYAITATASPLAGGSVSCTPNPVPHGSSSTCTATPNAGYTFSGFSGACSGATCVLSNVTSTQSVTATFTLNTYAITAAASPLAGGSVSCTPNPVSHGSSSICTATATVGYTFSAFSGACTGATCVLSNVTSAKSVTASFTINTYVITATASPLAGGSVSCTPNPVPHGSSSTCTATANVGYNFSSFSGDCTGATCVLNNVTTVKAVTANFLVNTPPVASNVGINGSIQMSRVLTGRYTYSDAQNDPQGISTFRWMRDSQISGATKVVVPGATAISYTVISSAQGRYMFFCVTPVATVGVTTGVEVCSSAVDIEISPPPPPPDDPPGGLHPVGFVGSPSVLDLRSANGTATMIGVASVLERVLIPGLRFVGQSSLGIVVMTAPSGQNYVFAPLAVQFNDLRADGLYPLGNGQYQVVVGGTALLIVPAVQNLDELVGLLPAGATARMENNGVLSATVGGLTYVVQPSFWTIPQVSLSAGATLAVAADGYLHFTDSKGNNQTLYPAILEPDVLLRSLQSTDINAALRIEPDGTAQVRLQGRDSVWVADLVLSDLPPGMSSSLWWQEGPQRFRIRLQSSWTGALTQGFTIR